MIRFPRLVDGNLNEIKRLHPVDASISLNVIPLSTASITAKTSEMAPVRSYVEMYNVYGSVGVFRVRSVDGEYGDDISTMELDHAIVEVGDFVCDDEINETSTLSVALRKVFGYYKGSSWTLSEGAYSDEVVVDVNYDNVLEAMLGIMEQVPQYMMAFNFSTRPWTVSVTRKDTSVTAEGRLSRNVVSATVSYDDSDLCTKVYVDYQEDNEDQVWTATANTEVYGIIEKHVSGSGYTKSQAQTVANTYLQYHSEPTVSVTIDGLELADITGESLDSLALGKIYRLAIPKYRVVVDQPITGLTWPNVYTNPKSVEVSLATVEDPVVKFMKKTSKYGSSTSKKVKKSNKEYWTKFEQNDKEISMVAAHADKNGNILEQAGMMLDSSGLLVYAEDNVNNIGSKFRVQANAISAEVTRATAAEGTLSGRLVVTEQAITAEVTRATTAEGTLSGRIVVEANRITQEVTRAQGKENELSGRITVEADRITQEVTRATTAEGTLSGRITVEAGKITQIVSAVGKDGQVTAASICLAINNGGSTATINADKIYLLGQTIADTITANYIDAKISTLATLHAKDISANSITADVNLYLPNGLSVYSQGIWQMSLTLSGNTYTLKELKLNGDEREVGTFSRATTLTGAWDSGTYTVTASPQENTLSTTLQILSPDGSVSRSGKHVSRNFKAYYGPDEDHTADTGFQQTVSIDASSVWDAGQDAKYVDDLRITGNGNRYWDGDTYKQNVGVAADYNTGGSYVTAIAVDVTDAYNTGLDDGWYAYYDSGKWESPSSSNGWKAKIPTKEDSSKNETWLDLTSYSQWHPNSISMYCTEGGQVPGTQIYRYKFTVEASSNWGYEAGKSYSFYY